jgi:hypothetical protein
MPLLTCSVGCGGRKRCTYCPRTMTEIKAFSMPTSVRCVCTAWCRAGEGCRSGFGLGRGSGVVCGSLAPRGGAMLLMTRRAMRGKAESGTWKTRLARAAAAARAPSCGACGRQRLAGRVLVRGLLVLDVRCGFSAGSRGTCTPCVPSKRNTVTAPQRWDRLPYIYNFVKSKTGNPDGASCLACAVCVADACVALPCPPHGMWWIRVFLSSVFVTGVLLEPVCIIPWDNAHVVTRFPEQEDFLSIFFTHVYFVHVTTPVCTV